MMLWLLLVSVCTAQQYTTCFNTSCDNSYNFCDNGRCVYDCNEDYSCQGLKLECGNTSICTILCGGYLSCESVAQVCKDNSTCALSCTGVDSCSKSTVGCNNSFATGACSVICDTVASPKCSNATQGSAANADNLLQDAAREVFLYSVKKLGLPPGALQNYLITLSGDLQFLFQEDFLTENNTDVLERIRTIFEEELLNVSGSIFPISYVKLHPRVVLFYTGENFTILEPLIKAAIEEPLKTYSAKTAYLLVDKKSMNISFGVEVPTSQAILGSALVAYAGPLVAKLVSGVLPVLDTDVKFTYDGIDTTFPPSSPNNSIVKVGIRVPSGCAPPQPFWGSVCTWDPPNSGTGAKWFSQGTIQISVPDLVSAESVMVHSGSLIVSSNLAVESALVITGSITLSNTSTFSIQKSTEITVQSCAQKIGGSLHIKEQQQQEEQLLWKIQCNNGSISVTGMFDSVYVGNTRVSTNCIQVMQGVDRLTVKYSCGSNSGLSPGGIAAIVMGGVVAAVIAGIIVYKKLFPSYWESTGRHEEISTSRYS